MQWDDDDVFWSLNGPLQSILELCIIHWMYIFKPSILCEHEARLRHLQFFIHSSPSPKMLWKQLLQTKPSLSLQEGWFLSFWVVIASSLQCIGSKCYWAKTWLGQNILGQNSFGSEFHWVKTPLGQNSFGPKLLWVKTFLGQNSWVKTFWVKTFWVKTPTAA